MIRRAGAKATIAVPDADGEQPVRGAREER